jgi:polysaccharide biosynthesis protein PslG
MKNSRICRNLAYLLLLSLSSCGADSTGSTAAASRNRANPRLTADRLGVNVHRPTGDDARFLFDKVKELGAGWVRIDVSWDDIEIAKGEYNWNRSDEPIREAHARGLKILANINGTPKWANNHSEPNVAPNNSDDWKDFCGKVVQRYNGSESGLPRIDIFGIWNEPDGAGLKASANDPNRGNPELYINRILRPCSEAIRRSRPDAKTAGPELASETDFMQKLVSSAGDALDLYTIHKYSDDPSRVVAHLESIRSIIENSPRSRGKDIWLTETGWSTKSASRCWFDTVDDSTQAARSRQLLGHIESRSWIKKVFFYELRDDDNAGACQWGMLRSNGSEKQWYREFKDYIKNQPGTDPGEGGCSPEVPWGSYRSTCRNEVIRNGILYAQCKDRRGNLQNTSLKSYQNCGDIANDNGKLVCK